MTSSDLSFTELSAAEAEKLEHEAYGWVVRFVSGKASQSDLSALREWSARSPAHAAAFDQASRVWQDCAPVGALQTQSQQQAQYRLGAMARRPGMGRRAFIGGALAASAAAVLLADPPFGLWPSWSEFSADYRTETGQQRKIALAENVTIDLNTQTSIALRGTAGAADRIELISGEAMISTLPQASLFTVVAGNGQVTASGDARFNLRCIDRAVCVTCLQGNIRVQCGSAELALPAGRQAIYTTQSIEPPVDADPVVVAAWQSGIVIFEATPLTKVIDEINRYRPGRIIITDAELGNKRFTARFRIANIDHVLGQIEDVFGARVTTLPGGIVLLG